MSDAEKAWEARERFFAENGYPKQTDYLRGVSYIGFMAGWNARDQEVAELRAERDALQARLDAMTPVWAELRTPLHVTAVGPWVFEEGKGQ